jgi:hypothetical protein
MFSLKKKYAVIVPLAFVLAACGGGDGDNNPPNQNANDPALLTPLAGRWTLPCTSSVDSAKKAGTDTFLSLAYEFNWQVQGGKLVGTQTTRVLEATDCSGTPLATWTSAAELTAQGVKTASGKTATKVQISVAPMLQGFGGPTITLNQVTYLNQTGTWTTPVSAKDLMYREGNLLFLGDADATEDAEGYAAVLDLAPESAWVKSD